MDAENSYTRMMKVCKDRGFGERPGEVAAYLTKHGLTVNPSTISNWKLRGGLGLAALLKVSKIIGVSAESLTHGAQIDINDPVPLLPAPKTGITPKSILIGDILNFYTGLSNEDRAILRSHLALVDGHPRPMKEENRSKNRSRSIDAKRSGAKATVPQIDSFAGGSLSASSSRLGVRGLDGAEKMVPSVRPVKSEGNIPMDTLTLRDLAVILRIDPRTLQNRIYKDPKSVPPWVKLPGQSRLIWLREDVENWLKAHRQT